MFTTITRRIEIDYGHVLPNHFSFCNQIHGHRGVIEVTVSGEISTEFGASNEGMVLDFSFIKDIMMKKIHSILDHGFAVWVHDNTEVHAGIGNGIAIKVSVKEFIIARNTKVLILDEPPTAEILAKWAYKEFEKELYIRYQRSVDDGLLSLEKVRWYETPNNFAEYSCKS